MTMALASRLADRLTGRGETLVVAESCTGGLLGARLTDEGGASRFFLAGLTTYSNEAKTSLLGVPEPLLEAHGAVSEEVARAMATGARSRTGATASLAITGVAGPGGGTPAKPVGTVWIAASLGDAITARRFSFPGDRPDIREAAVREALIMLESLLDAGG